MRVAALADRLKHSRLVLGASGIEIVAVTNDSREVEPGWLYAAIPGLHVDGHRFIPDAIRSGAQAILCERLPDDPATDVAWFVSPTVRLALSEIADLVAGSPSRRIGVIGVTGTDGKTSTVYFTHQLIREIAGASAFLSTASMQIGDHEEANVRHQSTPEAPEVHRTLLRMHESGAEYAVLESTSHGLSRQTCRLAHVRYRAAVFTNLSHEHLEFHGTFEQYRSDKANLFRALDAGRYGDADQPAVGEEGTHAPQRDCGAASEPIERPISQPFGVVNLDDRNAGYFCAATRQPVITYGLTERAVGPDYRATGITLETTGSRFELITPTGTAACSIPVPGRFNISNALAAAATVQTLTGCTNEDLARAVGTLRSVRGRMSVVLGEPFSVVVDYAHTPGSFENVLPFFRDQCAARLIVLFGSAGERDVAKREIQGRLAHEYADIIVLADEDPRGEDPVSILEQIAAGAPSRNRGETIHLIPDRREAIRTAFGIARPGDTVLLLGKGHEATIIGAHETVRWDEIEVAKEELEALGYR